MSENNSKQYFLRGLLILMILVIAMYTLKAIQNEGLNFTDDMVEFIMSMGWMGQFTLDFCCYLFLSGLWVAWRHQFSANGIILGILALFLGLLFFAPYLLYQIAQTKGDLKKLMIGSRS